MKIAGLDASVPVTDVIVLPRGQADPLKLTIQALALGMEETALEIFPAPRPPLRKVPLGDSPKGKGAPLYLYDDNDKLVLKPDPSDPGFVKEQKRHNQGFSAFVCYHGLAKEANVTWETPVPLKEKDPAAFYLAVYQEMKGSGLAAGDVMAIVEKVMDLSNFSKKKIDAAKRDFLAGDAAGE